MEHGRRVILQRFREGAYNCEFTMADADADADADFRITDWPTNIL